MDPWSLYAMMKRSRRFEEAVTRLWNQGLISGEMHLGTGEEAIMAGVVSQLTPGDAMAVDHRGSAAFLMRGVAPRLLLREMLGCADGLCAGQGGHMHLFSKEYLAASSGIVGATGPAAVGFALAAQRLRPGTLAVAFFGEGALNQGMLMESIHLASQWRLPVLFVCKDDGWAITTRPEPGAGSMMEHRVSGLGARFMEVDGLDVQQVWQAAREAIGSLRAGRGPVFLRARCIHLGGHYLGYALHRAIRSPQREMPKMFGRLAGSFLRREGGSLPERWAGMQFVLSTTLAAARELARLPDQDPLKRLRGSLSSNPARLRELEHGIDTEISNAVAAAVEGVA